MKHYYKITPEGTRDTLFKESLYRRHYENVLLSLFAKNGFNEVSTPGIEYYDMFTQSILSMPQENLYKLTDNKGRLITMRPDCTLPIARLVSTRMQNAHLPIRLCYAQSVYRNHPSLTGKSNEILQAGVELIGANGLRSDLEIMKLAAISFEKCGIDDFIIEIGHADIFKELVSRLPIRYDNIEEIKRLIENKNYAALSDCLDKLGDTPEVNAVRQLPRMFGGKEILDMACEICHLQDSEALKYLRKVYESLCELGLKDKIMFDLGLVHQNEYYSGVIFRGYVKGFGDTVLSGGRYDNVLPQFGVDMPATGFAVNVDAVADINLERNRDYLKMTDPSFLVHAMDGYQAHALQYFHLLSKSLDDKSSCEFSTFDTVDEAKQYAISRKIPKIIVVTDTINTIELD